MVISQKDPLLKELVNELIHKYHCHTVILYGSRARGDFTDKSDYDLLGVKKSGKIFRLCEKRQGFYIDIFVYPEKDLKKIDESHLYMNHGKVLFEEKSFGTTLLKKIQLVSKKKFKPRPPDEIQMIRVWLHKMLERASQDDLEGHYRRSWLQESLLGDYFALRKKRFLGSKQSFTWLKAHDPLTYELFIEALKHPSDLLALKKLVERVSGRQHH